MTYRERREAKAARLQEWAAKRHAKADAGFKVGEQYRGDTAFWTQPGRIPERERVWQAHHRAGEHREKAESMGARAAGIQSQLDRAIYSDDDDAIERLEERIAELEAQRERMKTLNADFRKAHRNELKALTPYGRDQAMPHQSFELTNLTGNINRNRKRLEALRQQAARPDAPNRIIQARRNGDCDRCGDGIEVGTLIGRYTDGWSHVSEDGDGWKRCEA